MKAIIKHWENGECSLITMLEALYYTNQELTEEEVAYMQVVIEEQQNRLRAEEKILLMIKEV